MRDANDGFEPELRCGLRGAIRAMRARGFKMAQRIVVGMSGGVDSSVAALLLREQGWSVIGVTLHLWDYAKEGHAGRCCAPEDQYDAARVCASLGVPHYTFDRRELFREKVVDRFVSDYASGLTPSPCVRCNESVKLGPLYEIGRRLGASHVATGHYARIEREGDGVRLRAARDREKDQSYFLWPAPLEALRALVLPLGEMTKPEAREDAERAGLTNASKPDSTDLCFVEGDNYASFVEKHASAPAASRSPSRRPTAPWWASTAGFTRSRWVSGAASAPGERPATCCASSPSARR